MTEAKRPRLFAVTGPDGSGKSTLCASLVETLNADGRFGKVIEVSIWDALKRRPSPTSKRQVIEELTRLESAARVPYVFEQLREAMRWADSRNADTWILNGYWFKYAASELAYGADPEGVFAEAIAFPSPEATFMLEIDPAAASARRANPTRYEQGMLPALGAPPAAVSFVEFQREIGRHWPRVEALAGPWIRLPATASPAELLERVRAHVVGALPRLPRRRRAHAVVLNPHSGVGRGALRWKRFLESAPALTHRLEEAPVFLCPEKVSSPDQLRPRLLAWVEERVLAGDRNFVAAGGDGTVNLVLNALIETRRRHPELERELSRDLALGAIGIGSSNDFHKPFSREGRGMVEGIPFRLEFGTARPADVVELQADAADPRYFVVNASLGACAEGGDMLMTEAGLVGGMKKLWVDGAIAIAAAKLITLNRQLRAHLQIDDEPAREVPVTNLGVVKNAHLAGSMRYDGDHRPDDGTVGVYLCEGLRRAEMVRVFSGLARGRFEQRPKTTSRRARRVSVWSERPFPVEFDGEIIRTSRARLEVIPREFALCP